MSELIAKREIEIITCESGDWEVVRVGDGREFIESGHSINGHQWVKLLKYLGFDVKEICLSDEEMEDGDY